MSYSSCILSKSWLIRWVVTAEEVRDSCEISGILLRVEETRLLDRLLDLIMFDIIEI